MKYLLQFILFLCIFSEIDAQEYSFKYDAFSSQFYGIEQKDSIVIVYGSSGTILRSVDGGYTWNKYFPFSIDTKTTKVIVYNNEFIASCDPSGANNDFLSKSTDGIIWTEYMKFEKGNIKDILSDGSDLYIYYQKDNTIAMIDKIDINKNMTTIFDIKDFNLKYGVYDRFVLHKNKFYFESWSKLYSYDYINKMVDSIEVTDMFPIEQKWVKTQFPRTKNGNLYICALPALLKSADEGKTWEALSMDSVNIYNFSDNAVYTLKTRLNWDNCKKADFRINKIENGKNENIGYENWERYVRDVQVSEMKFINKNTIAVCGDNSFLAVSYNKGMSWNLINNVEAGISQDWIDKDTGFIFANYGVLFKTTDGGKFWRPQIFTDTMKSLVYYSLSNPEKAMMCGFARTGGLLEILPNKRIDVTDLTGYTNTSNILKSYDNGETTYPQYIDSLNTPEDRLLPFYSTSEKYFPLRNAINWNNKRFYYSKFHVFDFNNNYLSLRFIPNWYFYGMGSKNGNLYAVASDCIDSLFEIQPDKLYLIKSLDNGENWIKIKNLESYYKAGYLKFAENYFDQYAVDSLTNQNIIRRFDIETGDKIDSVFLETNNGYYRADNKALIFENGKCFINEDIDTDLKTWKVVLDSSLQIFFLKCNIGNEFYGSIGSSACRLTITGMSDIKETQNSDYLSTEPPYPVPAKDYVKGKFYYYAGGLASTEINIYNSMGVKVATNKDIEIEPKNGYTAELKWNCSAVLTGTYLIVITTPNGKSQTLPVMVAR